MINVLLVQPPAGPNPPGLLEINIVLLDKVISIPDIDENNELVGDLVLKEGTTMYRFSTSHLGSSLDWDSKDSDEGEYYESTVDYIHPHILQNSHKFFKKFKNRDLLLIVKDFHRNQYLVGTMDYPVIRKERASTGGGSGMNGTKLTFECESPDPPKYFVGQFNIVEEENENPQIVMVDFSELDFSEIDFY